MMHSINFALTDDKHQLCHHPWPPAIHSMIIIWENSWLWLMQRCILWICWEVLIIKSALGTPVLRHQGVVGMPNDLLARGGREGDWFQYFVWRLFRNLSLLWNVRV
jgi:hypothetical protein